MHDLQTATDWTPATVNGRLTGSMTALVTPFSGDGAALDLAALEHLVERQIAAGTRGLVPVGTTGESPTLSDDEKAEVIATVVRAAAGRAVVIAGTGSNNTAETILASRRAERLGVDALMVVCPAYNRPSQEGLFQHFRAVMEATSLPIIVYNIPGRAGVDMSVATLARLAHLPGSRIVGVKDATRDLGRPLETRLACGPEFIQLSGEDSTIAAFLAQGGHGCISVTANTAPALCAALHQAWAAGDLAAMARARDALMPLHTAVFADTSPAPTKYALARLGLCAEALRLPLVPAHAAARALVDHALDAVGLLPAEAAAAGATAGAASPVLAVAG